MKEKNNYLEYSPLVIVIIISFVLRVLTAEKMGWLADDVYHVIYINEWFLDHFKEYFFQLQHTNYPPMSPVFGNPPLAMWFMTFGMYIAKIIGTPMLIGARFVNIIFGLFTIILTYIIGRKWFSKNTAIISSIFLGLSPAVIASDSSAYLDTILSFFLMLDIYILFRYLDSTDKKDKNLFSILLGLSLGFSLLAKLYILSIIGIISIFFIIRYIINRNDLNNYIIMIILIISVPIIMWAGARDLNHLQNVFSFTSSMRTGNYIGMFADYIGVPGVGDENVLYYFLILYGRLAPIFVIAFLFSIFYIVYKNYCEISSKNISLYTIRYNLLMIMIIVSVLFIYFFGGMIRTTIHRVIFIVPLISLLSSDILVILYTSIIKRYNRYKIGYWPLIKYNRYKVSYWPLIILIVILLGIPIFTLSPEFYNTYNNFLVNGLEGGSKIYHVGDGDGLEIVGNWIMSNTDNNSIIGIYNFAPTLEQYVKNRTVIGLPLNSNFEYAISKHVKYLVVHNYIVSGSTRFAHDFSKFDPIFTVYVEDYPYIIVYDISSVKWDKIDINYSNWWFQTLSNKSNISINKVNGDIHLNYNVFANDWIFALNDLNPRIEEKYDGIYLELYGDNNNENFFLDLSAAKGIGYYRNSIIVDWTGYKDLFFPFNQSQKHNNITLSEIKYLKLSIDSKTNKTGKLIISNLAYFRIKK